MRRRNSKSGPYVVCRSFILVLGGTNRCKKMLFHRLVAHQYVIGQKWGQRHGPNVGPTSFKSDDTLVGYPALLKMDIASAFEGRQQKWPSLGRYSQCGMRHDDSHNNYICSQGRLPVACNVIIHTTIMCVVKGAYCLTSKFRNLGQSSKFDNEIF